MKKKNSQLREKLFVDQKKVPEMESSSLHEFKNVICLLLRRDMITIPLLVNEVRALFIFETVEIPFYYMKARGS